MASKDQDREPVVAVCGAEARIYGPKEENGVRPLLNIKQLPHHGAALLFAQEFEDRDRRVTRKAQ